MKKKYDRQSKKWMEPEEYDRKQKKRKLCKGGKEHDYVEILPHGVKYNDKYKFNVDPYHEAMAKIEELKQGVIKELEEKHGIIVRIGMGYRHGLRYYACTECGKRDYKTKD